MHLKDIQIIYLHGYGFYGFHKYVITYINLIKLLSSLIRVEGNLVKKILFKIAKFYPQAIYYTLRAFLVEKRHLKQNKYLSKSELSENNKNRQTFESGKCLALKLKK